jgi:hypothetical protein
VANVRNTPDIYLKGLKRNHKNPQLVQLAPLKCGSEALPSEPKWAVPHHECNSLSEIQGQYWTKQVPRCVRTYRCALCSPGRCAARGQTSGAAQSETDVEAEDEPFWVDETTGTKQSI